MDNDGRFPDDEPVEVRYPRTRAQERGDRALWPWLPGSIAQQVGPNEWQVVVEVRQLTTLEDGRPARANTPDHKRFYPMCWRDSSEIRRRQP